MANVMSAPAAAALGANDQQRSTRALRLAPLPTSRPFDHDGTAAPSTVRCRPFVPFETRWDAKDVAAYLKCSQSWVYKHAESGTLPCERYGGLLRFDPGTIRALGCRPE